MAMAAAALKHIDHVTQQPHEIQRGLLREILSQNQEVEYLRRIKVDGATKDAEYTFCRLAPLTEYEDILPDIRRIANGDTSAILSGKPITEFLTSSGTSGGQSKLTPTIEDDMNRRCRLYSLLIPVISGFVPGLDEGKALNLLFVRAETCTPGGLPARPVLTSFYRSCHFLERTCSAPPI